MTTADPFATVTRLRRAKGSDIFFHEATCSRAGNTVPWIWAEGRSVDEVREALKNGLRPCKVCNPMGLATEEIR